MTDNPRDRLAEIKARRANDYRQCSEAAPGMDIDWLVAELEAARKQLDRAHALSNDVGKTLVEATGGISEDALAWGRQEAEKIVQQDNDHD